MEAGKDKALLFYPDLCPALSTKGSLNSDPCALLYARITDAENKPSPMG